MPFHLVDGHYCNTVSHIYFKANLIRLNVKEKKILYNFHDLCFNQINFLMWMSTSKIKYKKKNFDFEFKFRNNF